METRHYGRGTSVTVTMPFHFFLNAKVLCSDGVVRKTERLARTADTFFSVPASVQVKSKSVSGYLTFEETADGQHVATFRRYDYGKNAAMLPAGGPNLNREVAA